MSENEYVEMIIDRSTVKVDVELAPLIREMNKLGLVTTSCCSGHGETDAYVSISLKSFVDIAISNDSCQTLVLWWNPAGHRKTNLKKVIHREMR